MTKSAMGPTWRLVRRSREDRRAAVDMREARSYAEWMEAAARYDRASGADAWRAEDASPHYDHALIRSRLEELETLRGRGDDHRLLYALNEGVHGNLGGMGRGVLYRRAASGTKRLIVRYTDAVVEAIEHLAAETQSGIPWDAKDAFFRRASLCYGHTALMLSGSGTLFFFHIGVLRALLEEQLLPRILSGSSGGAMMAAVVGTRTPGRARDALDLETFHHFIDARRFPFTAHRRLQEQEAEIMATLFPEDLTFEEAFAQSGVSVNVSVAPTDLHQRSRLLNAVTSPHVFIREAVLASTAFPGVFPPVTLMAKTADGERAPYLPTRRWVDGSVSDDLPAKRLARLFGVNHYIVSQTNPHVLPFLTDWKLDPSTLAVMRRTGQRALRELVNGSAAIGLPALRFSRRATRVANTLLSVINQDYLGDINILPPQVPPPNPFRILDYRSEEEALDLVRAGERATWPTLAMIRTQTKISRTLDRILARSAHDRL